jgi:O-antigen ligase
VGAAVLAAVAAAPFKGVASLTGSTSTREAQGAIVLALLAVIMAAAVALLRVLVRRPSGDLNLPRHAALIVLGLACLGLALAIVLGAKETSKLPSGTSAARYTTLSSDRYEYWRVALDAFRAQPLRGIGAGGWQVDWLRLRHNAGFARDAHSLELQTLAELGLVGLALLLVFLGGMVVAARRAHARAPALAAGPVAALVVYLVHSPLDWDWQLPALTLVAVLLAGLVLALSDEPFRREADDAGHASPRARTAVGV